MAGGGDLAGGGDQDKTVVEGVLPTKVTATTGPGQAVQQDRNFMQAEDNNLYTFCTFHRKCKRIIDNISTYTQVYTHLSKEV